MKSKVVILNIDNNNNNYEITSSNGLIGFTRGQQSMVDNTAPYYGVTASYGSVKFYDNENTIERYANLGYLKNNKKVQLYLGDDIVGTYETAKFSKEGQIVTLELQDLLIRSQNIDIGFHYDYNQSINNYIISKATENGYTFASGCTSQFVDSGNEVLFENKLWTQLDKIAKLSQICVFTNENGEIDVNTNPNRKTLKIRNFDYYTTPKLNPFNNNYVENVSIDRYIEKEEKETNEDDEEIARLTNFKNVSFEGVNKTKGYKFDLFYGESDLYYGQDYMYMSDIENQNGIKAKIPALSYKELDYVITPASGGVVNYKIKTNLMYLRVRLPISDDGSIFAKPYSDFLSEVKAKFTCRYFTDFGYAGISQYTLTFDEQRLGKWVLEDERAMNEYFYDLMDFYDEIGVTYQVEMQKSSYWISDGGKALEILLLIPTNTYLDIQSTNQVIYSAKREIVYEKIEVTVNGVHTFKYDILETKLFDDISEDLELGSNELIDEDKAITNLQNTYQEWKDGKKTLNFTCYKGNYYDTNGNLVYNSSSGDTIKVGDTIIPYINVGGIEKPIGNVDDDTPIEYVVTSSEIEYNGNTKLHLSVVEK